eukprot:Nk52_evm1s475 gene=Nk52_evmTU1s475
MAPVVPSAEIQADEYDDSGDHESRQGTSTAPSIPEDIEHLSREDLLSFVRQQLQQRTSQTSAAPAAPVQQRRNSTSARAAMPPNACKDERRRSYKAIVEDNVTSSELPEKLLKQDIESLRKFLSTVTSQTVKDYYNQLKESKCFGLKYDRGFSNFDIEKDVEDEKKREELKKKHFTLPMVPLGACGKLLTYAARSLLRQMSE